MTTHSIHEDVHERGLWPGCLRCEELATHPGDLDDRMKARLLSGHVESPLDRMALELLRAELVADGELVIREHLVAEHGLEAELVADHSANAVYVMHVRAHEELAELASRTGAAITLEIEESFHGSSSEILEGGEPGAER